MSNISLTVDNQSFKLVPVSKRTNKTENPDVDTTHRQEQLVGSVRLERSPDGDTLLFLSHPKEKISTEPSKKTESPIQVSNLDAILRRIPQDVVDRINETRELPPNLMIKPNPSLWSLFPSPVLTPVLEQPYILSWRSPQFNGKMTGGTSILPDMYELKNTMFGTTVVVPKGYEHWTIPNVPRSEEI